MCENFKDKEDMYVYNDSLSSSDPKQKFPTKLLS